MTFNLPKLGKPTKYGYRCSKGFILKNGRETQQVFWLGPDPALATQRISIIESAAAGIEKAANGRLVWTPELVMVVKQRLDVMSKPFALPAIASMPPVNSVQVFPSAPLPPPVQRYNLNLHAALDQFCDWIRTRNEIATKTREIICHRVASLKFHLPNVPLSNVAFDSLQQFRSIITARPATRRREDSKDNAVTPPISLMTTRNWLQTLGQAFRWFKKTDRWIKPNGLDTDDLMAVFFLSKSEIMRLSRDRGERERLNKPKPTLTIDELAIYYKLAVGSQRLYLLLGICLGWRQRQITDLRKDDIVVRNGEYFVRFVRTKTGVDGDLWLCPELATLLLERVGRTPANHENYALMTENELPLVHTSAKGHDTDSIRLTWDALRRRAAKAGCRSLPFDSLRRFAGQAVSNLSDPFLAQVFLAQVPESILEKHYAARGIGVGIGTTAFEKVHEVQREVHAVLMPMFEAGRTDMQTLKRRLLENHGKGNDSSRAA